MKCPHELWISSAQLLPVWMRSPACFQKVEDVHVCPCLCQAPTSVCVSQAVSQEEGEEVG